VKRVKRLTIQDRKKILELWDSGKTKLEIAAALGISLPTVYKELERGQTGETDCNFQEKYDPALGQTVYNARLKNCGRRPAAAEKHSSEG